MIAEYHLTSTSQGTHNITPVLPEGATPLMPPLDDYLPGVFEGCHDVRVIDRAQVLRVATWLHCLDLCATYGAEVSASPRVEEYDIGPLLEYFLMPKPPASLSRRSQHGLPRKTTRRWRGHCGTSMKRGTCSGMRSGCFPMLVTMNIRRKVKSPLRGDWTTAERNSNPMRSASPGWRSS